MPAFLSDHAQGTFLRNQGNGMCIDVRGTMETSYEEDVIIYDCEIPGSNYSRDQRWQMRPNGLLVNELSGMCLDSRGLAGEAEGAPAALRQWPCEGPLTDGAQRFELTSEGFLRNQNGGQCVNSALEMYACPYTDQTWRFQPDGHLVNRLSGLCLTVAGNAAEDGSNLQLGACEGTDDTDRRWQLTAEGVLRNMMSGKCVTVRNQQGRENQPYLVLATCPTSSLAKEMQWVLTSDGFLKNRKNAKCIDAEGSPGITNGTRLMLARCEDKHIDTSGLWAQMEGGFIRNIGNDYEAQHRCLEVFGERDTDQKLLAGAKLHLTGCETNTDQRWEVTNLGYIKSVLGGQKCMDIKPGSLNDQLWLQNCEEPKDAAFYEDYRWNLTPENLIQNTLTLECLDVHGVFGDGPGANVVSRPCNRSAPNPHQQWDWTPTGYFIHRSTRLCMDVVGAPGVTDGSRLGLWNCENRTTGQAGIPTDQRWSTTPENFLQNRLSGKCLHGPRGGQPEIRACPAANTRQLWDITPEGQIRNRQTGRCVDVQRNETVGTNQPWHLFSWFCDSTRKNQLWERVNAPH